MQVTEPAASEWAAAEGIETFSPEDLFDPKVNLDAGTWYLARALRHWAHMDDPVPFALAEYNAGRSRVRRWVDAGANSAKELEAVIDFPSTKEYIASIMRRYRLYLERGAFAEKPGGQF
jgi:soluble lytic murein transglycosylase